MTASERLHAWVVAHASVPVRPQDVDERTPLLARGLLTSLQIVELILFLEELSGRPVDVARLRPGAFRDLATIRRAFLGLAR